MISVMLVAVGGLLVFLGVTKQLSILTVPSDLPKSRGWAQIDLWRFLVAGAIVSVPVVVLTESGREDAANAYVALELLSLLVVYYRQVEQFAGEIRRL